MDSFSVLLEAVRNNDLESVISAVGDGADPLLNSSLALREAIEEADDDIVEFLIPLSDITVMLNSPLRIAIKKGRTRIVGRLLDMESGGKKSITSTTFVLREAIEERWKGNEHRLLERADLEQVRRILTERQDFESISRLDRLVFSSKTRTDGESARRNSSL